MIYLFDKWINNSDRTLSPIGGNVNIIFNYLNNRYYLIDHNLAFNHDEHPNDFEYHVYSERHRSWVFDIVDKEEGEHFLKRVKKSLSVTLNSIPQEWALDGAVENKEFLDFVEATIDRISNESFWRSIE